MNHSWKHNYSHFRSRPFGKRFVKLPFPDIVCHAALLVKRLYPGYQYSKHGPRLHNAIFCRAWNGKSFSLCFITRDAGFMCKNAGYVLNY